MSVWSFDAADLDNARLDSRPIYITPDIQQFLNFDKSNKRIICGLKGTGKTLFLKLISKYHRERSGFTLLPANELTERLYSIDYDFSGDRIKAWASAERWKHVWRTVLSVVVLKALNYPLSDSVCELFPKTLGISVGAHLSAAINSRTVNNPKFQELFPNHLDVGIQNISHGVALFLDNIDEALARHAGDDLLQNSIEKRTQSGAHSYDLWLSAQIGFLLANRELSDRNSHLKLFGTVRTEAVRDNLSPLAFNLRASILDLQYSPLELRGIFSKKLETLRANNPAMFCRPHESDHIKAFFPSDQFNHPVVRNTDGSPFAEEVFEYLRRHTRGRPRELDFLGHALQNIPCEFRTPDNVREVVRSHSTRFFYFARNEAVPFWDPRLDELLKHISCNFIKRKHAESITQKFYGEDTLNLWETLRANGLCGAVVHDHPHGMIQKFSQHDGIRELSQTDFRTARMWVTHPCVNIAVRSRRIRYKAYPWCVAGHAYSFPKNGKIKKKHIHVLIGAGKLGLGLITPVLIKDSGTKVIIVARFSEKWIPLVSAASRDRQYLEIQHPSLSYSFNSKKELIGIKVVSDDLPEWEDDLHRSLKKSACIILISHRRNSLQKALKLADSIGISVGADNIEMVAEEILEFLPLRSRIILAYENDEIKVNLLQRLLTAQGLSVIPTVVDRICSDLKISERGIVVRAEEYGVITAYSGMNPIHMPTCFSNDLVEEANAVSKSEDFDFVRERKKRLVNTLHFCAAAIALTKLREVEAIQEVADSKILGMLSGNMDIQAQLIGLKEVMILTVLGTLHLEKMNRSSLEKIVQELNEYGDIALKRMRESHDAPSRVLRGDIETIKRKYLRLIADVREYSMKAICNKIVFELFQIKKEEIDARLNALNSLLFNFVVRSSGQLRSH